MKGESMKHEYYRTCERCGAHLDPGEKCDCEEEREDLSSFPADLEERQEEGAAA